MKRRSIGLIGVVATFSLLLTACSSNTGDDGGQTDSDKDPASVETSEGGTLSVAMTRDPEATLDPTEISLFEAFSVLQPMCDGMYQVADDGELVPELVTDSEVSDDGLTVTYGLVEDALFNDGTEFNAEAVKASLERAAENSPYFASVPLESIDAVDDTTVAIHLTAPYAPLDSDLAGPGGMIVSPTAVEEQGEDFAKAPVCVGPYEFDERQAGEFISLKKSEHYYDADRAQLDEIIFKIIPDPNARLNAVRTGDVQVAIRPEDNEIADDDAGEGLDVLNTSIYSWTGFIVNVDNADGVGEPAARADTALAQDPVLRQAFSVALNRDALTEIGSSGLDAPSCSLIPEIAPLHDTADCGMGDPEKARQMIESTGVSMPVPVSITGSANRASSLQMMQAAQGMLNDAGFDATIDECEGQVCLERTLAGEFDTAFVALDGTPDPDAIVTPAIGTGGKFATHGFSDPKLDDILDDARSTYDSDERQALYQEAMDRFRDNGNIIIVSNGHYAAVVSNDVTGAETLPTGTIGVVDAAFVK